MTVAIHVDQELDRSCLGASEAAGVLGLDKYNPPIRIWRKHRGLPIRGDEDSEPAYWGRVLEPVIRGKYAHDRHVRVFVPTSSYTLDGWLRYTPDGLVEEPTLHTHHVGTVEFRPDGEGYAPIVARLRSEGSLGGLQVKTCSAWLEDDWRDGPPAKHEVQCRVEMAVGDLPWVDIVCLCGGQKQIGPLRIERDKTIEDRILTSLREFWAMVQSGQEPGVDHSDTWRMHVSEKMDRIKPTVTVADNELLSDVALWRERRINRKHSEHDEEQIKNALLLHLAAAGATKIDCGDRANNVTAYRTKSGTWALRTPSSWKDDDKR